MTTTRIDLLRHGEVENDSVFCGSTDEILSDYGWQQMVKALENKSDWDRVVCSPLQRCREFAALIAKEDDIELQVDKNLQEMDYGLWEGLSPDDILREESELLHNWWKAPTRYSPPEGEDFHFFQARVLSSFKSLISENKGQKILLVTDAGVIRVILMHALGMCDENLFRLNVDYACFSRINIYHDETEDRPCLISHG